MFKDDYRSVHNEKERNVRGRCKAELKEFNGANGPGYFKDECSHVQQIYNTKMDGERESVMKLDEQMGFCFKY